MKKFLTMFLVLTLCLSVFIPALAAEPEGTSVVDAPQITEVISPEFPDAYILTEFYDKDNIDASDISVNNGNVSIGFSEQRTPLDEEKTFTIKDQELAKAIENGEEEIVGIIEATVFFEEEYEIVNEQGEQIVQINNSRLLTKEEVESIGVENFESVDQLESANTLSPMVSDSQTNSRGKLTISFILTELSSSGYAACYNLRSDSSWSGLPLFPELGGSDNPGYGDDYIGLTWGGSYDYYDYNAGVAWDSNVASSVYLSDATPNVGLVWSFSEFRNFNGQLYNYVNLATAYARIRKTNLTGSGNTTAAVFKYIHTYQAHNGSISMSAGAGGVSGSFSLSGVDKQWSLACTISSIPY